MTKGWRAYAATVVGPPPDLDAPTVPTSVVATFTSPNVGLTWTASTDTGTGVAGYEVFRDGGKVGTSTTTTFLDINVPVGNHIWTVNAFDGASPSNVSAQSAWSNAITVTAPDTTPPTTPTSPNATYSAPTVTFTWGASTDTESGLGGYIISRNGVDIFFQSGTTFTDSGRPPGTYVYGVRAFDLATPVNESPTVTSSVTIAANTAHTPNLSDGSGANDVGGELASFFSSMPQGTALAPTIVAFQTNIIYRVERTITTIKAHTVIHGNGATVLHKTLGPFKGQFWPQNDDISVDHLTVRGPNKAIGSDGYNSLYPGSPGGIGGQYEGMHGWRIVENDTITLDHCDVYNVYGDGWSFDGSARCTDCTVTNSQSYWTGRHGLNPNSVNNFLADHVTCIKAGRHLIDIEPDGAGGEGHDGLTITNFAGDGGALGWLGAQGGGTSPGGNQMDNLVVDTVSLTNQFMVSSIGRSSRTHHNVTIKNVNGMHNWANVQPNNLNVNGSTGSVLDFTNVTGITVQNCHQPVQNNHTMYFVFCTSDCTVTDVSGNGGANIDAELVGP